MQKPDGKQGVVAAKVFDLMPFMQAIPNSMQMVQCDDDIEQELVKKNLDNNDFLLYKFTDKLEDYQKYALYKYNQEEILNDDLKERVLGKRKSWNSDALEKAVQLELVRDYGYTDFNI